MHACMHAIRDGIIFKSQLTLHQPKTGGGHFRTAFHWLSTMFSPGVVEATLDALRSSIEKNRNEASLYDERIRAPLAPQQQELVNEYRATVGGKPDKVGQFPLNFVHSRRSKKNNVITQKASLDFSTVRSLRDGTWLNDNAINLYLGYFHSSLPPDTKAKSLFFPTHFIPQLQLGNTEDQLYFKNVGKDCSGHTHRVSLICLSPHRTTPHQTMPRPLLQKHGDVPGEHLFQPLDRFCRAHAPRAHRCVRQLWTKRCPTYQAQDCRCSRPFPQFAVSRLYPHDPANRSRAQVEPLLCQRDTSAEQ